MNDSSEQKDVYCVRKTDVEDDGVEYPIGVFSSIKNAYELGVLPLIEGYGINEIEIPSLETFQEMFKTGMESVSVAHAGKRLYINVAREILDVNSYC